MQIDQRVHKNFQLNESFSITDFQVINMNTFLTANFVDLFQAKDLVDMVSEAAKKKNKLLEKFIAVMMKVASY